MKTRKDFTPGPWTVYEKWVVLDRTGRTVAEAVGQLNPDERNANARLIAASPDLLECLKIAEAFMEGFEDDETQVGISKRLKWIRDAIEKAEGR